MLELNLWLSLYPLGKLELMPDYPGQEACSYRMLCLFSSAKMLC